MDLGSVRLVAALGEPIAVREWGSPSGRPLLFVHGLGPVNSSAFLGLSVEPLVSAGYRVVGIDLPGFGGSPGGTGSAYELDALGSLVWSVADACSISETVVLGHSWGAVIACYAAAAAPSRVSALVLADAGHRDPSEPLDATLEEIITGAEGVRLRAADRAGVAAAFEITDGDPMVDAVLAALVEDGSGGLVSASTAEVLANARYRAMRARPSGTWPVIASAGIPTLALLATEPKAALADNERDRVAFVTAVPQATVIMATGASHQMITDLRERFGTLVADWLSRVEDARLPAG